MVGSGKVGLGEARRGKVGRGMAIFILGGFMTYQWKSGAHLRADAEKVGREVEKIRGDKTPEKLVRYAETHTNSELFSCFEWDNDKAAEKYRLEQAGHILACLVITKTEYEPTVKKEVKVSEYRAYENVMTEKGRAYVRTEVALSTPEYKKQVFDRIRSGIVSLENLGETYREMLKNPKKFKEALQKSLEFV